MELGKRNLNPKVGKYFQWTISYYLNLDLYFSWPVQSLHDQHFHSCIVSDSIVLKLHLHSPLGKLGRFKNRSVSNTYTAPVSRHSFFIGFSASIIWHGDTLVNCSITEPGPVFTGLFLSAHYAAFSPVFNIICGLLVLPVYSWYIFAGTFR